jgi:hypothetical protein
MSNYRRIMYEDRCQIYALAAPRDHASTTEHFLLLTLRFSADDFSSYYDFKFDLLAMRRCRTMCQPGC